MEIGRGLAKRLRAPVLVFLCGDLGSGKTTMAKGIISGLGAAREEDVTSPTFTLVHVFRNGFPNPCRCITWIFTAWSAFAIWSRWGWKTPLPNRAW